MIYSVIDRAQVLLSAQNEIMHEFCVPLAYRYPYMYAFMMTSSNGNGFCVTSHLCGKFTGEFPTQRPVMPSFDVFFDLRLNERLNKQSWGWWFEMPWRPLWRHSNVIFLYMMLCPCYIWCYVHFVKKKEKRKKKQELSSLDTINTAWFYYIP